MWSRSGLGLDGLGQCGIAQTGDQAVLCFWENPRLGPGLLSLVRSRPGPNRSGTKLPQHYNMSRCVSRHSTPSPPPSSCFPLHPLTYGVHAHPLSCHPYTLTCHPPSMYNAPNVPPTPCAALHVDLLPTPQASWGHLVPHAHALRPL